MLSIFWVFVGHQEGHLTLSVPQVYFCDHWLIYMWTWKIAAKLVMFSLLLLSFVYLFDRIQVSLASKTLNFVCWNCMVTSMILWGKNCWLFAMETSSLLISVWSRFSNIVSLILTAMVLRRCWKLRKCSSCLEILNLLKFWLIWWAVLSNYDYLEFIAVIKIDTQTQ